MRFRVKLFLAIFGTAAFLTLLVVVATYYELKRSEERQFYEQYNVQAGIVGGTFQQLEKVTSQVNLNAVKVLSEIEQKRGLIDDKELDQLANSLQVKSMYIIDRNGEFLRASDIALKDTKNLFSFCPAYDQLIKGNSQIEETPILPSFPSNIPAKYVMIPNHNRTRILESGVWLGFTSQILRDAVAADKNLISIGVYSPNGYELGYIEAAGEFVQDLTGKKNISSLQPGVVIQKDRMTLISKIPASSERCCECIIKNVSASDGKYFYLLRMEISLSSLAEYTRTLRNQLILLFGVTVILAFFLSRLLAKKLVHRLGLVDAGVTRIIASGDLHSRVNLTGSDEIASLGRNFDTMLASLADSQEKLLSSERAEAFAKLAHQIVHDIRSPLAALDTACQLTREIPEKSRLIIRQASSRIKDIANTLVKSMKSVETTSEENSSIEMFSSLVELIITEKRVQYRAKTQVEISATFDTSIYGVFVDVVRRDFERVLSNLLNNAVEAIPNNGKVEISVKSSPNQVQLLISDTGIGIPAHIIPKLGHEGVSHGKSDAESGSGLGLYHARTVLESLGGALKIESEVGRGTTVTIVLPRAPTPSWFVPEIFVASETQILALDDDPSIHELWKTRIGQQFQSFSTIASFEAALSTIERNNLRCLIDYELIGESRTGLDTIERLELVSVASLVTSRFDDPAIRERCQRLGIGIIPKVVAGLIPIRMSAPQERHRAILIDDDQLVRAIWEISAYRAGVDLRIFESPAEFEHEQSQLPRDAEIYIDSVFPDGMRGESFLAKLRELGFTRITITTGMEPTSFKADCRVIGKEPPF